MDQGLIQTLGKQLHRPLEPVSIASNERLGQGLGGAPPLHRENLLEIFGHNLLLGLRHVGQDNECVWAFDPKRAPDVRRAPPPPRPGKLGHRRLADEGNWTGAKVLACHAAMSTTP